MSSVKRRPVPLCVRTLLVLFLSVLIGHHPHPPSANAKKLNVRIAAILPRLSATGNDWLFAMERVSPAIKIALDNVNDEERMGFRLTVEYRDGRCDIAESLNHAIEYYVNREVDVFFGPCCDYPAAPIARQTRYWNIPMLTAGTMAGEFGFEKRTLYPMLTRVGPNINSMASFVVDLMSQHKWKKAKILYDSEAQGEIVSRLCHLVASGMYETFRNFNDALNDANMELYIKHANFKLTKPFTDEDFRDEIGYHYAGK